MDYPLLKKIVPGYCIKDAKLALDILLLRDKEEDASQISQTTMFHVRNNDYLGTTATVIDLHLQVNDQERMRLALQKIRDDLIHLQKNYKLVRKKKKKI